MWGISLPSLACEVCHGGEATSSCSDVGDDGKPDERCREVDEEVWCHWKYADDGDWQRKCSGQSLSTRKVLRRCESAIVKREPGAWLEMGLMSVPHQTVHGLGWKTQVLGLRSRKCEERYAGGKSQQNKTGAILFTRVDSRAGSRW